MGNKNSIAAGPAGVATMMATAKGVTGEARKNQQSVDGDNILKLY